MYEKIKRIRGWFKGKQKGPVSLEINPTNLCNLSCKFCHGFQGGLTGKKSKELSQSTCIRIIKEAPDLDVKEVHIAGDGEPLMKKSIFKSLVKSIKENKMFGTLTTNGTLFTPELIELMIKLDWDLVTISLEGYDAKTHDYLTGSKSSYKRIIKNIVLFNHYKKILKKDKPMIKFSTIIMEKNKQQLSKIIELAHKLKVDSVLFEPLIINNHPGIKKLKMKNTGILKKEITKTEILADRYKIFTNIEFMDKNKNIITRELSSILDDKPVQKGLPQPYCYQPWYKMVIRPDGKVQPCCNFYDKNAESVYKKSLKDIWLGQYFTKIRENILNNKHYEPCKSCNAWIIKENEEIRNIINNPLIISKIGLKECFKKTLQNIF